MDKEFKKLSEVQSFKVVKVVKSFYQKWNEAEKKYERSDTPSKGFSQRYLVEMDDCIINMSKAQVGEMLVGSLDGSGADIAGKSFTVRNNGKTGIEIRYFINPMGDWAEHVPQAIKEKDIQVSEIPF